MRVRSPHFIPSSSPVARFAVALSIAISAPGRAMISADRTKELKGLWATSFDAWQNVPNHHESIVYLRPASTEVNPSGYDATCKTLPSIVKDVSMFALTSFNPMGEDRAVELNRAANQRLRKDLENLTNPQPRYIWDAFGFAKDWREDGFVVAYDKKDKRDGEAAIIALARQYEQGAIYGFEAGSDVQPTKIIRRTIPAAMSNVEADVVVVPCEKPEGLPFAEPSAFKGVKGPVGMDT